MTSAAVTFTLQGPMQSWATMPGGAARPTGDAPTKTAIIGFVANALGRDRADSVDDLAALRFGVRHDRPGIRDVDYHTTGSGRMPLLPGEVLADPTARSAAAKNGWAAVERGYTPVTGVKQSRGETVATRSKHGSITRDHYLADAAFTVALTGGTDTIQAISNALVAPARLLYLGRRAYPLTEAPTPHVHNHDELDAALAAHPVAGAHQHDQCRRDVETSDGPLVDDQPTHYGRRDFTMRRARTIHPDTPATAAPPVIDFFDPH